MDYSDGMLESAKKTVEEIQECYPDKGLKFVLDKRDATDFSYPVVGFEHIMANHMLYHLNRESRCHLYKKINELLSWDGRFSYSLIGQMHMCEIHEFVKEFYPEIKIPSAGFDIWLETASEELGQYFLIWEVEEQKS